MHFFYKAFLFSGSGLVLMFGYVDGLKIYPLVLCNYNEAISDIA